MSLYETLGVARTAPIEEIKKAYRTLVRKYHPDLHPDDPSAVVRFREITSAYEVVGDIHKRSEYDVKGYVGRRPPPNQPVPKPAPVKPPEPPPQPVNAEECTYFGGNQTGRNIMVHLKINPHELVNGGKKIVRVRKREICNRCIGDGSAQIMCSSCRGSGKMYIGQHAPDCLKCDGAGYDQKTCPVCKGVGVDQWIVKEIAVVFPHHSQYGEQIMVVGEGEAAPGKAPGYLRVVLLPL